MLAFIHVFSICVVATILFVSVDEINQIRLALALKFLIIFCERRGNRRKADAIISRWTERTDAPTAVGLAKGMIDQIPH